MIAEIMLVSEGFMDFKPLAKKMVTLYTMMVQQMSKQVLVYWSIIPLSQISDMRLDSTGLVD